MCCEDGIGMYSCKHSNKSVSIHTIECKYIWKGHGAVTRECDDFPDKCEICKNNTRTTHEINLGIPKMKSYFKER